ncbi:MAG: phosphodiester glycosidase family protein [Anaerolineales bacterium]|nr:phosphodiester glycosidase family protein [Anaerolineales bacterium]
MRITPTQTSFSPDGPPPSFRLETGGLPFCAVQIANDAALLNGAFAARRTQANFFDSWHGDDRGYSTSGRRPLRREVAGQPLAAPTGRLTYTLPPAAWARMRGATQFFYRLMAFADERRRGARATLEDVDWRRAPSVSIARLPAQPARSPTAAFRGRGVLSRDDFLEQAADQTADGTIVHGRDGDFYFAVLKADCFHLTVVEAHAWGLTDTVAAMPRKPDAVINGQFIASAIGLGTEGEVIREGARVNADSTPTRYYLGQTWRGSDISDFHIAQGNPSVVEPEALRAAFGGLGPVLLSGAAVSPLTPWAQSLYARGRDIGRGVIALHRARGLILLLVQATIPFYASAANAMTLAELRDWLQQQGFAEAIFNDGSDSEALYAGGGWQLTPGWVKDEAMDFALGFVNRQRNRRVNFLAIDGTKSADGEAFARTVKRPLITHYSPRNLGFDLRAEPALAAIAATFQSPLYVLQAWRAATQAQAEVIGRIVELAGHSVHWADVLYLSSHAWRHGQLWYYANDDHAQPKRMLADPWSDGFQPLWRTTPSWLIIAGCAVLALRYSRGVRLDGIERGHLVDWHHDIHGASASVPGLVPATQTVFAVYHPGWAWYERIFQHSPSLRGVLGYWYRSPSGGRDAEIVEDFTLRLTQGESFLSAWEAANRGGWLEAEALWAAMVRPGCEDDTLATLEDAGRRLASGAFTYYDRFQRGRTMTAAFGFANRLDEVSTVGGVTIRRNAGYDDLAIAELEALAVSPSAANFLAYTDGVGP